VYVDKIIIFLIILLELDLRVL